jgi:hypothetical protein
VSTIHRNESLICVAIIVPASFIMSGLRDGRAGFDSWERQQ